MFDATGDYVTCDRCRRVRAVNLRACPYCERLDALEVERYGRSLTRERPKRRARKGKL